MKYTLWQVDIFLYKNDNHEAIKNGLVDYIKQVEASQLYDIESGVATGIKHNLKESHFNFFESPNKEVKLMYDFCHDKLRQTIEEVNSSIWQGRKSNVCTEIHESWYHITKTGGFHDTHTHSNCSWCGIYYIDSGDKYPMHERGMIPSLFGGLMEETMGGQTRFYNTATTNGYTDAGNMHLASKGTHTIVPEDGLLVIFPSHLFHSVTPYIGTESRINVAFNSRTNFYTTKEE